MPSRKFHNSRPNSAASAFACRSSPLVVSLPTTSPQRSGLARRGFRLCEVPAHMRERHAGRSFYTFGKTLYYPYKNLLASLMAMLQKPQS